MRVPSARGCTAVVIRGLGLGIEEFDVCVTPTVGLVKGEKAGVYAWGLDESLELGFNFLLG